MSIIAIDLSGFPVEFPVYKLENGKVNIISYATPELAGTLIPTLCSLHDIDKVQITGIRDYISSIAEEIQENSLTKYSKTIEIEVI